MLRRLRTSWLLFCCGWCIAFLPSCVKSARVVTAPKVKAPVDSDKDGVPDKDDLCPKHPGFKHQRGCNFYLDMDNDKLVGADDRCPLKAGPRANQGCPLPDQDKDGVPDKFDRCPKVAGLKMAGGCPAKDTDKDGVPNTLDRCPKVVGPEATSGCPYRDTDNDGIPDHLDQCPKVAGPKVAKGCPIKDTDKDGIPDHLDKCPYIPGTKRGFKGHQVGCPKVQACPILVPLIVESLFFKPRTLQLKEGSLKLLDEAYQTLQKNPNLWVRIGGHTDNHFSKKESLRLSKKRALLVRNYLVKRGISPKRLKIHLFGLSRPMVPYSYRKRDYWNSRVTLKIIKR